ncbi:MAG: hypothetical protein KGK14_02925 [Bacteroidota bacterium]|nr:hypothetical protein [Bacteroidota bacterium]
MIMNLNDIFPENFSEQSKVWIYQSDRILSNKEATELHPILQSFTSEWNSHGAPVKGYANLVLNSFIILMADEDQTPVSGCSLDTSVHAIKKIEKKLNINLFNRQLLAFLVKDEIKMIPYAHIEPAIQNGVIDQHTPYFNNLVSTKKELLEKWIIPAEKSWLGKRFFNV